LQRILGMINYLRDFIPNLSTIISPLRQLLKKGVIWTWNDIHTKILKKVKQLIAQPPVLSQFDPNKEIVIQCDASKNGLACCLLQEGKPISFASRSLTETEVGYAQIEKEMLSILFATRKFLLLQGD
jgi:hypothetical protein